MSKSGWLPKVVSQSPVLARVAPFVVFVVLTWLQDHTGAQGRYWLYAAKTVVVGWMLWELRPALSEMRWQWSWAALAAGIGVFVLWVGLDDGLARLGLKHPYHKWQLGGAVWMPQATLGLGLGWALNVARLLGSSPGMAGGSSLRLRLPGAGLLERPFGRRHHRARDHQPAAGLVGYGPGPVAVLVRRRENDQGPRAKDR